MHRITRRRGDVSAQRPKRVVALWLVALVAFGVLAGTAGGTAVDDFVAPGSQSAQAQELLQDRFPDAANGRALAVFVAPDGDSIQAHRDGISAALEEVAAVSGVVAVRDPFTDGTISQDGRVGYATIAFDKPNTRVGKPAITALGQALAATREDGLAAEVGGDAAFVNSETEPSGTEVVGLIAALVILVIAFGAAVAAVVPIVLALAFIPVVIGSIRVVQLLGGPAGIEPDSRFDDAPSAVVVHIAASIAFAVLGAFQFSARTRRRHPAWHRRTGRVLVPLGLVVASSALWLTLLYDRKEGTGTLLSSVRLLVGTGMGACILLGFAAVRRRDTGSHRAWMTRAYALALGAGTQPFTVGFGEALLGTGVVRNDLLLSAGWGANLAVAEVVIRRARPPALPRQRRPVAAAQAPLIRRSTSS